MPNHTDPIYIVGWQNNSSKTIYYFWQFDGMYDHDYIIFYNLMTCLIGKRNWKQKETRKGLSISKVNKKTDTLSPTVKVSMARRDREEALTLTNPTSSSFPITALDPLDAEFGFSRPDFRTSQLAGSVEFYQRHVFLCYKNPQVWPPKIEASEFDQVPRLLSAAIMARKADMNKKVCVSPWFFFFVVFSFILVKVGFGILLIEIGFLCDFVEFFVKCWYVFIVNLVNWNGFFVWFWRLLFKMLIWVHCKFSEWKWVLCDLGGFCSRSLYWFNENLVNLNLDSYVILEAFVLNVDMGSL